MYTKRVKIKTNNLINNFETAKNGKYYTISRPNQNLRLFIKKGVDDKVDKRGNWVFLLSTRIFK